MCSWLGWTVRYLTTHCTESLILTFLSPPAQIINCLVCSTRLHDDDSIDLHRYSGIPKKYSNKDMYVLGDSFDYVQLHDRNRHVHKVLWMEEGCGATLRPCEFSLTRQGFKRENKINSSPIFLSPHCPATPDLRLRYTPSYGLAGKSCRI